MVVALARLAVTAPDHRASLSFLAILTAGAALLRWIGLESWDVWTDEVQTLWVSASGEFREGPMYRTAPLNFWVTGGTTRWLGVDIVAARLPSFAFGVATVGLFYLLSRRWLGERPARFAAVLLALSFWHVYWSQNARHFALQTLLLLLALHGFCLWFREGRRVGLVWLSLPLLAALFTHSSSGFYGGALGLFAVGAGAAALRGPEGAAAPAFRRALVAAIAVGVPLLLYAPVYLSVGRYLLEYKTAWNPPWNVAGSLAFYVPPYLALPALGGALYLARERSALAPLLLLFGAVPAVLVVAAAQFTIASGAYCLTSLLAVAALAGVACDRLLGSAQDAVGRWALATLVAAFFVAAANDLAHYYLFWNGLKPRWHELTQRVAAERRPDEVLVAADGDAAVYYLGEKDNDWLRERFQQRAGAPDAWDEDTGGVWYAIYWTPSLLPGYDPRLLEHLRERTRLVDLYPLHYGAKSQTLALFHERLPGRAGEPDPEGEPRSRSGRPRSTDAPIESSP